MAEFYAKRNEAHVGVFALSYRQRTDDDGRIIPSYAADPNGVHLGVDNIAMQDDDGRAMKSSSIEMTNGVPMVRVEKRHPDEKDAHPHRYSSDKDKEALGEQERPTWGGQIDFLLSIIGFAVDLANVWRFPFFCYKNGGGAFLIPYFLMLIFGALPLFYMELVLGQFNSEGPITVWKIAPLFKGIGFSICTISYLVAFYYNVIIAWSFMYLFSSFTAVLPWTTCDNDWNTCKCWDGTKNVTACTEDNGNVTYFNESTAMASSQEFWSRRVLGLYESEGMGDLGTIQWPLALCLLLVFVILYFVLWKGVKSSGKVVWFTATMPYIVLLIFLIRGSLLPGAVKGLEYFITPKIDRLKDPVVWIDAAVQIFYSVGAGFGVHLAYSSYNKFHNNCYRDCLITAGVNSFTSLFSGVVIFIYLGYMSEKQNRPIDKVAAEGPGLVFEVYPEAIATLPGSTAWSILFFLMLLTLGFDSSMGGMESVLTGLKDNYRNFLGKYKWSREILVGVVMVIAYLVGLVNITKGGYYVFNWFDAFAAGTSLLFMVFCEAVVVAWFYGLDQFCDDIESMLGFRPGIFWRICWKFISPLFVGGIVVATIVTFQPLNPGPYPYWSNILGWLMVAVVTGIVPLYAIFQLIVTEGSFKQRLAILISPYYEHDEIRKTGNVKRFKLKHWLSLGGGNCC